MSNFGENYIKHQHDACLILLLNSIVLIIQDSYLKQNVK